MAIEPGSQSPPERRGEWVLVPLAALLAVILIVFYGLFDTALVEGDSMEPTLMPQDRVLVTESYAVPQRGDVVVARVTDESGRVQDLVKRVVGVPGDLVEVRDDVAYVNGTPESGHLFTVDPQAAVDVPPRKLGVEEVFVMGDNRAVSLDSRFFGPVALDDVEGRVVAVFSPVTRLQIVN